MPNPFDTLGAVDYDPQYQMGFIKKLGKSIKKAAKKVDKTVRKVQVKITPKPLMKVNRKIEGALKNNKLVQGAVTAVASVVGTPAVGLAVKGAFAASNAAQARKSGKDAIKKQNKLTALAKDPRTSQQALLMEQQGFSPDEIIKSFDKKPVKMDKRTALEKRRTSKTATQNLQPVVKEMEEAGFTQEQINNAWINSDAFKNEAIKASQSEAPAVAANLISSGMPQAQAQSLAPVIAANQAAQEVDAMREQTAPNNMPLYLGLGLLGALLLMKKNG